MQASVCFTIYSDLFLPAASDPVNSTVAESDLNSDHDNGASSIAAVEAAAIEAAAAAAAASEEQSTTEHTTSVRLSESWKCSGKQGCQMAKFDPFPSLDCAGVEIKFCSVA